MSEEQYGYTFKDSRSCNVVETGCLAPPAHSDSYTKATCYRCGEPTCTNCSRRRVYLRYGRQRLCNNCIEEMER